jgi:diacylglycerol kinase (ATP)
MRWHGYQNRRLHVAESVEYAGQSRRCAVIYNPTKVSDKFRALVEESLHRNGWGNTLWLETSVEDPGQAMTKQTLAVEVDLVIAAGGDGTIRVADGLAHTAIPLGLVPAGTGNLLARTWTFHLRKQTPSKSPSTGSTHSFVILTQTSHPDASLTARPARMQSPDTPEPFGTRS